MLDLPAGTPREEALAVGPAAGAPAPAGARGARTCRSTRGVAAPFTFVGMVRHSFLRDAPEQVDLQVQPRPQGRAQGAEPRHRRRACGRRSRRSRARAGARLKVVEIPPGPPVLDTLVAEVYGPTAAERDAPAPARSLDAFRTTPGVVDVDSSLEPRPRRSCSLASTARRRRCTACTPAAVVETLAAAGAGVDAGHASTSTRGATRCRSCCSSPPAQRARLDRAAPAHRARARAARCRSRELVRAEPRRASAPTSSTRT